MRNVLVVGGTRGLGSALVHYHASKPSTTVYATSRKSAPADSPSHIKWIPNIDLTQSSCGTSLASALSGVQLSTIFITAGIFQLEPFDDPGPKWDIEVATYTTSAIAPPFIVSELFKADCLPKNADTKIILLSSEAGSLMLQQAGGGGNYAHHASKSALNMVGLQLKYDLEPHGIAIGMVHPSFMRTEMTKGVGFDIAWDENEALTPEQAAEMLGKWTDEEFGMSKTGEFWAPRGTRDIGSWKDVMGGEHIKGPVKLPW